jgi:hypothetical protein
MNNSIYKIDINKIQNDILDCINKSFDLIDSSDKQSATSYGVWLDTRFGRFSISLNYDDDSSYRCDEISSYNGGCICGVNLIEISEFNHLYESSYDEEIKIEAEIESELKLLEYEDLDKILYDYTYELLKKVFLKRPNNKWSPYWVRFENNNYESQHWKVNPNKLPKESVWTDEIIEGKRLESARNNSICVYKIGYKCRKYNGFDFEKHTLLDGSLITNTDKVPLELRSRTGMYRDGDLAPVGFSKDFALNVNSDHYLAIKKLLKDHIEFVPFEHQKSRWELCNSTHVADVLNLETTKITNSRFGSSEIREIEFDENKLEKLKSNIFKIKEKPEMGTFLISKSNSEGLLELCEKHGIRGVAFDLIWTNNEKVLNDLSEKFTNLVKQRLLRLNGKADVKESLYIECLSGYQVDLWRLLEAHRFFQNNGAKSVVENITGLNDIKNPKLSRLVPSNWSFSNKGKEEETIEKLDKEFKNKTLLEGMNGYLTRMLPKGIKDIEKMEKSNSGHMAILGPEI